VANWNGMREPRLGCLLHYDASTSDAGAVQWLLHDSRAKVSYNWLVLDSGEIVNIAPADVRAWHAGICRTSDPRLPYKDANSAFYGIAIAATAGDIATEAQKQSVADLCTQCFKRHGWDFKQLWRIVGHDTEAWPRGRKVDPVGPDPRRPVMSVLEIRGLVGSGVPVIAPA
jgi:N-acetyl-anhydromuramyl-L-alanine amidase AmpD